MDTIQVTKSHNKHFIWNPEDIVMLRKKFRMPGTLIGPASTPPLLLTKYEFRLLHELEAVSVSCINDRKDPLVVKSASDRYSDHLNKAHENYSKLHYDDRVAHIMENKESIITKFRQRNDAESKTNEQIMTEKIDQIETATLEYMPVQLFTESPFHEFKELNVTIANCDMDRGDEIRYQAFKTLWKAGFCLTSGAKFASDFLVYENDPAVCHAKYMLSCRESEAELKDLEIVLRGRLSVQVAKRALFAIVRLPLPGLCDQKVEISFVRLVWEGKKLTANKIR